MIKEKIEKFLKEKGLITEGHIQFALQEQKITKEKNKQQQLTKQKQEGQKKQDKARPRTP